MSYQDKIYNQNNNFNRNSVGLAYNTSSDLCLFKKPKFNMFSAKKINCDGNPLNLKSSNVYSITGNEEISLDFNFIENLDSFINNNTLFKFEIYKYNNTLGFFNQNQIYTSEAYNWGDISGTSAITETIYSDDLGIDGDYLIKGYYIYDSCTEFAKLNNKSYSTKGDKSGLEYGLYDNNFDYHFVAFSTPDKPIFEKSENTDNEFGYLNSISQILTGDEDFLSYPDYSGDLIVNLNGLTLSLNNDYGFYDLTPGGKNVIKLSGETYEGDVLTYVYTNSLTKPDNSLKQDTIDITSQIVSGPIDEEGSNKVYFNTTKNKYEIYTELLPSQFNDIVVTLNGITLINGVDYYRSTSNPYRLILEGDLFIEDIINIWYNTDTQINGSIFTDKINIEWSINTAPENSNGKFILELSNNDLFTDIVNTNEINYIENTLTYSSTLGIVGSFGQTMYYRVINEKDYVDICGDVIISQTNSDVVKIIIETNTINSY